MNPKNRYHLTPLLFALWLNACSHDANSTPSTDSEQTDAAAQTSESHMDSGVEFDASAENPLQQKLDALVQSELGEIGAIGMGVSVELPDGRVFEASAGNVGPQEQATPYDVGSTKQILGSVTKLFTAVMVLQLIEESRLDLDAKVNHWFSFAGADDITVRMLLQHTSGLADCLNLMTTEQYAQDWSPQALVDLAVNADRLSAPGGDAFYSNTNFALLALIVEQETGESWQANLARRIALPLDLRHTYYAGDADGANHLVDGWMHQGNEWVGTLQYTNPSIGWGYGAIASTNRELSRFFDALYAGALFAKPETLAQMLDFTASMDASVLEPGEPPQTVGLGIIRYQIGDLVLDGHLGHILGYHSAVLRDPETGVLMTGTANTEGAIVALSLIKIALALRDM